MMEGWSQLFQLNSVLHRQIATWLGAVHAVQLASAPLARHVMQGYNLARVRRLRFSEPLGAVAHQPTAQVETA